MNKSAVWVPLTTLLLYSSGIVVLPMHAMQMSTLGSTELNSFDAECIDLQAEQITNTSQTNNFLPCQPTNQCPDEASVSLLAPEQQALLAAVNSNLLISTSATSLPLDLANNGTAIDTNNSPTVDIQQSRDTDTSIAQSVNLQQTQASNPIYAEAIVGLTENICQCTLETTMCTISGTVPPIGGGGRGFPLPLLAAGLPPLLLLIDPRPPQPPQPPQGIPEPDTIIGTLAALSLGIYLQQRKKSRKAS